MYEELVNIKIKCVWRDGENSKAVYGVVKETNDLFLTILTDKDNSNLHIAFKDIISIKEVQQ
jgi:hypothetical protein